MNKKRFWLIALSLILAALTLLSSCTFADNNAATDDENSTAAIETAESYAEQTGSPAETVAALDDSTADAETEAPAPAAGTLLYYENFESEEISAASDTVLGKLGWKRDTKDNGAYNNGTVTYSIVDYNGSKQLYLKNNIDGGADSYVIVLSEAQFGKFHESAYTYQYDLTYDDASAADRYIVLVSDYNGSTYNSFHVRNRGNANNEAHINGSWISYDGNTNVATATDASSICTRLLGKTYNASTQVLKNISVSIRYVVDWTSGNKIYMRVNTEGYPGSGKWTLVGEGKKISPFTANETGGAIAIKTGGRQNGWIDNIIIWAGTGDEPSLTQQALVNSKTEGCSGHTYDGSNSCYDPEKCIYCGQIKNEVSHKYAATGIVSDRKCTVCGALESNEKTSWLLPSIPGYEGGTQAREVYRVGQGLNDAELARENDSEMAVIGNTDATQFDAYCGKLEKYGYKATFTNAYDGNKFAEYYDGTTRIYTYFTASAKETRVIIDRASTASVKDFGYTASGSGTVLYQYGLPYSVKGTGIGSNGENKIDCGMLYVIKLCDNKLFIIDGGGYQQFDTAEIDGLYKFLREITGTTESQKMQIAGWYFTHGHVDHFAGFALFVKKYASNLTLERLICNFPSVYTSDSTLSGHKSNISKLAKYINTYFRSDVPFLQIHTGEYVQIANLTVNCIYTHEDLVSAVSGECGISGDFNNSSIVSRFDFEGMKFMLLGDINKPAQTKILANNSEATLKSDVLQLAHHVINDMRDLYKVIKATAVFVPQSPAGATNGNRTRWFSVAQSYVENDMLYYASAGTYGIKSVGGKPVLAYSRDGVDGGPYANWGW